jgi:hypothetical protein
VKFLGLLDQSASTGIVRDENPLTVSHPFRLNVLVGQRVFPDRMDMNASLVGKGAVPDVGLMLVRGKIRDLTIPP